MNSEFLFSQALGLPVMVNKNRTLF